MNQEGQARTESRYEWKAADTMLTLLRQASPLAEPAHQRALIDGPSHDGLPQFESLLTDHSQFPLRAAGIDVLQVNLGKLCNQTCAHCHVDAGPERRESMSAETAEQCLAVLRDAEIATLDITGGAPEMNPCFRRLVTEARRLGRRVIDRCNLTILLAQGFDDLPEFLAEHRVEIVASLPAIWRRTPTGSEGKACSAVRSQRCDA